MTAPRRIVVVDDDAQIRRLLKDAFPAPEFEVHDFGQAKEALFKLHELAPEVILCDLRMPDMDGKGFLTVVKRSQELRDVPFLFLSGVRSNEDAVEMLEAGADDFLHKPFHLGRLVAKVRALLRMADRRHDTLTGPVGPQGTLSLLKFCEDSRITGRLTVADRYQRRFAEFLGGEIL